MKIFALVSSLLFAVSAHAFPVAPFNALTSDSTALNLADGEYDFEGIVKLSNCSGSIIKFDGQPMTSKAIVLTNGHCLSSFGGMLKPGEVIVNKNDSRSMKVYTKDMKLIPVKTSRVLYATMTNTDMTLFELTVSYEDLANKYQIDAFEFSSTRPFIGMNIDIVSGYWDRGYTCGIEAFIFKMKEADWMFTDSILYSAGCDVVGGTSGSPIVLKGTRNVIGVNNTGNESGKRCTMNNPCEIDERGEITVRKGGDYGQQTYNVYSCLRPDFNIDLSIPGCTLPKPIR